MNAHRFPDLTDTIANGMSASAAVVDAMGQVMILLVVVACVIIGLELLPRRRRLR